ncbi:MAG: ISAzo13 family transposase [Anaerolineales bacterium]|nr:ISAzo13 family transposase [Anaerolineales bacterium]
MKHFELMKKELNEKQWRHFLASEAKRIGYGGIRQVEESSGACWQTIKRGMEEIEAGELYQPGERVRKEGGGRKKLEAHYPGVEAAVERIADPKGDPESPLRWTSHSMEHIAEQVESAGYPISAMGVYRILKAQGFALKANKKEVEGKSNHPDRNAQFEHIAEQMHQMKKIGAPILSVDAKKAELIGNYKNSGREWQPKGSVERVNVHDFGEKDEKGRRVKGLPYGVYNALKQQGFVSVGIDHNTAAFAVASIRQYWEQDGKADYAAINEMLLLADGGGSNAANSRLWKVSLQQFANESGLSVHVCHYPPGTSKWNSIEHQLFSFISINWRAKPLICYEFMLELIRHTTTKTGLTVNAILDQNLYPTGIKISDQEMNQLNIERDEFHPEWNYIIRPQLK